MIVDQRQVTRRTSSRPGEQANGQTRSRVFRDPSNSISPAQVEVRPHLLLMHHQGVHRGPTTMFKLGLQHPTPPEAQLLSYRISPPCSLNEFSAPASAASTAPEATPPAPVEQPPNPHQETEGTPIQLQQRHPHCGRISMARTSSREVESGHWRRGS